MKSTEIDHILNNMRNLISFTNCDALLLSSLVQHDIFAVSDVDLLDSIPIRTEKAFKFYQIIITRENAYLPLLQALDEGLQTGAAEILRQVAESSLSLAMVKKRLNRFLCCGFMSTLESSSFDFNVTSIYFNVLPPVQLFTGREQELAQIHSKLQSRSSPVIISQMTSITGLGGIGKTELCRAYIQAHAPTFYKNVVWLLAESEVSLSKGFKRLAKDHLEISLQDVDGGQKNIQAIVDSVYNNFSGVKTLFVFDNAVNGSHINKYMPFRVPNKPFLLITSRDRQWGSGADVLSLDTLTEVDAINFVKRGLGFQNTIYDRAFHQLVTRLQCFPLALQQAISFIAQQQLVRRYDVVDYMVEYVASLEERRAQLSTQINSPCFNTYTLTTFTTWDLTMKVIRADEEFGRAAQTLLYVIAYLRAEKIPTTFLVKAVRHSKSNIWKFFDKLNMTERCFGKFNPKRQLEGALQLLIRYSMINSQPQEGTISIHRLVQDVTKLQCCDNNTEQDTLSKTLEILEIDLNNGCLNHVIHALKYARKYPALMRTHSQLPRRIVYELFQKKGAPNRCAKQLELLRKHLGIDYTDIIRTELITAILRTFFKCMNNAVDSWIRQVNDKLRNGNYPLCLVVEQDTSQGLDGLSSAALCLERFRKTLNGNSNVNFKSAIKSSLYQTILEETVSNEFENSNLITATEQRLKAEKANFALRGNQANQSREDLNNIFHDASDKLRRAFIFDSRYSEQADDQNVSEGRHAQNIEKVCYEISSILQKLNTFIYGKDHEETLDTLGLSGKLRSDFGKHAQALTIHQNVYNKLKNVLGSAHCSTLAAKCDVALTQSKLGRNHAAFELLSEVIQTESKTLGSEHEEVWYTKLFLAQVLINAERYEDAESVLFEVSSRFAERYGVTSFQYKEVEKLSKTMDRRVV